MSNFSALIATIQANIKTNGNEEITGAVLQDVLEAMVQALGTEAINNLETALGNEETARQNADGTLQNNIDAEALRAGTAEGVLQTAINGIKSNIDNGFVYAGIATPSGTPVSGKVFYLAVTAGTYTNYGTLVVTQGINILKNNGTAWSQEQLIALDNTPTPSSSGLVKSGGVFEEIMTNGSAFDLTVHNSGTTYADLSAALTAMDSLPAAYKKGGMSIKFVQTSDNKYVQYRLMSVDFSTTVADWQGIDNEPTAGSNNLVKSRGVFTNFINGCLPKVYQGIWGGPVDGKAIYNKSFSNRVCVEILSAGEIYIKLKTGFLFRQIFLVDANNYVLKTLVTAQDALSEYKCNIEGFLAITICKSDANESITPEDEPIDNIDYQTELNGYIPKLAQGYWDADENTQVGDLVTLVSDSAYRVAVAPLPSNTKLVLNNGYLIRRVVEVDERMHFISILSPVTLNAFDYKQKGSFLLITLQKSDDAKISPDDDIIGEIGPTEAECYAGSLMSYLKGDYTITTGNVVGSTASLVVIPNRSWKSGIINAKEGDIFYIKGAGGNNARLYAFLDSNNKVLEVFNNDSHVSVENVIKIVAPTNTAKIVVNICEKGVLADFMYNQSWTFKKEINLLQGAATDKYIDTKHLNRVTCNNKLASPFFLKTKPGYVIRAIAKYDAATGTFLGYSVPTSETRTQWHQQFGSNNYFYVPTFAKTDSSQAITPNEDIIDSVEFETRFEFLPKESAFKKAVFFGDSITHGVYSYWHNNVHDDAHRFNGFDMNANFASLTNDEIIAAATAYPGIPYFFGLLARCATVNLARRGSGFVQDTRNGGNFVDLIEGNPNKTLGGISAYNFSDVDLVLVSLGINDYLQHVTIGDINAFKLSGTPVRGTVIGNLAIGIKAILEQNPLCKIVVYSPYNSFGQVSKGGDYAPNPSIYYGDESTNYALGYDLGGGTLQDYIDAIDEVCNYYGIQHVPLSKGNVCNRLTMKNIMIDGLHPSKDSYIKLAAEIYGKCNFGE